MRQDLPLVMNSKYSNNKFDQLISIEGNEYLALYSSTFKSTTIFKIVNYENAEGLKLEYVKEFHDKIEYIGRHQNRLIINYDAYSLDACNQLDHTQDFHRVLNTNQF